MDARIEKLLAGRDAIEEAIEELEDKSKALTREMCIIAGHCPLCQNWHYPHCG